MELTVLTLRRGASENLFSAVSISCAALVYFTLPFPERMEGGEGGVIVVYEPFFVMYAAIHSGHWGIAYVRY